MKDENLLFLFSLFDVFYKNKHGPVPQTTFIILGDASDKKFITSTLQVLEKILVNLQSHHQN